eukprot:m.194063 g.194063  ORF g.194063 m.194063 type:complete len:325 (-) comp17612_c0_seq3:422-1396(-)
MTTEVSFSCSRDVHADDVELASGRRNLLDGQKDELVATPDHQLGEGRAVLNDLCNPVFVDSLRPGDVQLLQVARVLWDERQAFHVELVQAVERELRHARAVGADGEKRLVGQLHAPLQIQNTEVRVVFSDSNDRLVGDVAEVGHVKLLQLARLPQRRDACVGQRAQTADVERNQIRRKALQHGRHRSIRQELAVLHVQVGERREPGQVADVAAVQLHAVAEGELLERGGLRVGECLQRFAVDVGGEAEAKLAQAVALAHKGGHGAVCHLEAAIEHDLFEQLAALRETDEILVLQLAAVIQLQASQQGALHANGREAVALKICTV